MELAKRTVNFEFTDAIAVTHDPDIRDRILDWKHRECDDAMHALDKIPGTYWKVCDSFNGMPAFKKVASSFVLVNYHEASAGSVDLKLVAGSVNLKIVVVLIVPGSFGLQI